MNSKQIIECVPNFSEGRDLTIISRITETIERVNGVKLLHVDPGFSTNRTVVTFAGEPEAVIEAAFKAIEMARDLIDMQKHSGAHPRMGATDVCPLVPVSNISMEETSKYAVKLAERVGTLLKVPVYLYEASARAPHRKNLAEIRAGEYEGLEQKMKDPSWMPDFGPKEFNKKSGATVIGARAFLVAYNINLNTKSVRIANEIAYDVRELGRPLRDPVSQKILKNSEGQNLRVPGTCESLKAIGWYIEEYKFAQISMNLTDLNKTSLYKAFEECRKSAESHGALVTGSEIVGLIPKNSLIEAGKYFLKKQNRSQGVNEKELIQLAILSMGLDSIQKFEPEKRIIEYMIDDQKNPLISLSLQGFSEEVSSDSPAPGGGSVSAYVGVLAASLTAMVANLTAHKKGYESQFEFFSTQAEKAIHLQQKLLRLVDEDTRAFNAIMDAFRLPKGNPEEKKARKRAIRLATIQAIQTPLDTMEAAYSILEINLNMVLRGNPNSVSDAGVGALCIEAAVKGAAMNVKINAMSLDDEEMRNEYLKKSDEISFQTQKKVQEIISEVHKKFELQ